MNSSIKLVKLQDTKLMYCFRFRFRNLLNFYKLTTNYQKKKLSNQSYLPIASISSKRIRHLGINLSKEAKDLYSKNYKTLMKDIEHDINRWKDIQCSWIGRIDIIKVTILPKTIYRFSEIPVKIPMILPTELEQII